MQSIILNMVPGAITPILHCSQGDVGRKFSFTLQDDGESYTIPSGAVVWIEGSKADGHGFAYDSTRQPETVAYSGDTVTITTTEQMTACAGKATCELKIVSGDTILYTLNFILHVEAAALPDDADMSASDIPLVKQAIEAGEKLEVLSDQLDKAAELVSTMETLEKATETSADNAKTSAANAAASATAAKNSQTSAAGDATKAATQATASADFAKESANSATLSQSWAVGGTVTRDGEDSDNSKFYAQQSAEQAAAAAGSATAAATSAANASTSETNAQMSATAAAESAETAKTYATSDYAKAAQSYAVGGTGTREGEDADNAKYYYNKVKDTDVGNLTELEKMIEQNLNSINHDQSTYPAFVADRQADVTDLNTCLTNGIYQFTAGAANNPVNAVGMVLVLNSTGSGETGYIAQYAWAANDAHTVYARDDHGGTWGAWRKLSADVDDALSSTSENAVQNKVVKAAIDDKANQTDVEIIEADITNLVGSDSGKSVRTIANEELTTQLIPENAKESLDTLKEIAAWIQSHPDDAAAMNEELAALKQRVSNIHSYKEVTISASGWSTSTNSDRYYTYTISGLTIYDENPEIFLKDGDSVEWLQKSAYMSIDKAETGDGSIILYTPQTGLKDFTILIKGVA